MRFSQHALRLAWCAACLLSPLVQADGPDWGDAKLGFEYELETGARNAWQSHGVTLVPGIKLHDGWIDMVELLVEGAHELDRQSGERSSERKIGLRLRHDTPLGEDSKIVWRGLVGHHRFGSESLTYYYLEPSLRKEFHHLELMLGYRYVHGFNAPRGYDLHKLRLGPGFELSDKSELEFRWVRSWSVQTGQHVSDACIVEYTMKF